MISTQACYRDVQQGQVQVALIQGETGIGKTRLGSTMLWTISILDLARMLAPFVLGYSVILSLAVTILGCAQISTTQPQTSYSNVQIS